MRLDERIRQGGRGAISRLAEAVDRSPSTVRKWALPQGHPDKVYPDRDSAVRLYRATEGAVTPNDIFDLPALAERGEGPAVSGSEGS